MTYERLIETISEIVENEKIEKTGLNLLFSLPEDDLVKLNKEFYLKSDPYGVDFVPNDEFEVMIGGILVKFEKI